MASRPMKTCNVCRLTTSLDGFYRNRAQLDGYDHACKKCKNEQNARYSDRKGYQRSYYLKNKERILDSQIHCNIANSASIKKEVQNV